MYRYCSLVYNYCFFTDLYRALLGAFDAASGGLILFFLLRQETMEYFKKKKSGNFFNGKNYKHFVTEHLLQMLQIRKIVTFIIQFI